MRWWGRKGKGEQREEEERVAMKVDGWLPYEIKTFKSLLPIF